MNRAHICFPSPSLLYRAKRSVEVSHTSLSPALDKCGVLIRRAFEILWTCLPSHLVERAQFRLPQQHGNFSRVACSCLESGIILGDSLGTGLWVWCAMGAATEKN